MKALVTGTGRCGTGYMAHILTRSGLRCGHEEVFTAHGPQYPIGARAESSWMAAPFLRDRRDDLTVLVYRSPLEVVRSFLGIGFFETDSVYRTFMERHNPNVAGRRPIEAACEHYVTWNRRILNDTAGDLFVIQIDGPDQRFYDLGHRLDIGIDQGVLDSGGRAINHRRRERRINTEDLTDAAWDVWFELRNLG